ncbi:MAG: tetratricopeptide repeat protein [Leptolyngbya sp. SIO4C1]|nr:tetratricopeptide repeat protein [Leptolyngbya sp. SIO4C1]
MNFRQLLGNKTSQNLGGRYRLIEPLGQGGFGHTFLAEDLHLPDQPRCVIKQLKPHLQDEESLKTARRLFDTEARVLYRLGEHPQIPRLLAHFEDQGEFYLAQELIVGQSLSALIQPGQRWPEARVIALLIDILTPLVYVHEQGVIHRDLKPANLIRRAADEHIVLIDFGAVKQVSQQLTQPHAEPTRTISIGTQGYMPNEQLAGNPRFSSDVYAVGMIGLQALTGVAPALLKQDARTSEICWQKPELAVSPALAEVLMRMVRYDFRDRYETAAEALQAVAENQPAADPPTLLAAPTTRPVPPAEKREPATDPTAATLAAEPRDQDPTAATLAAEPSKADRTAATLAAKQLGMPPLAPVDSIQAKTAVAEVSVPTQRHQRWPVLAAGVAAVLLLGPVRMWLSPQAAPDAVSGTEVAAAPAADAPSVADQLATALQLQNQGEYEAAISAYDQVLVSDDAVVEAHWGRCYSFNQLQAYNAAIEACDRALALEPQNPQALWSKGYALEQQGQLEAALALYDATVQADPDYFEAWNNQGVLLLKLERPQEAVAAFDRALALDETFAAAWSNRGAALWRLRAFDDAITSIDRALALDANHPEAQQLREQARQKLGR